MARCMVTGCSASNATGGGIMLQEGGRLAMEDCAVTGNLAKWGGGVAVGGACSLTMTGSSVSGNTAQQGGGGVDVQGLSTVSLTSVTVSNNAAHGLADASPNPRHSPERLLAPAHVPASPTQAAGSAVDCA